MEDTNKKLEDFVEEKVEVVEAKVEEVKEVLENPEGLDEEDLPFDRKPYEFIHNFEKRYARYPHDLPVKISGDVGIIALPLHLSVLLFDDLLKFCNVFGRGFESGLDGRLPFDRLSCRKDVCH